MTTSTVYQPGSSRAMLTGLLIALIGAAAFGVIAYESIQFSRGGGRIAAVWLPNALAVAFLLRASLPREDLFIGALWVGNFIANLTVGDAAMRAGGFATANIVEIVAAVMLVRKTCGLRPNMTEIGHLTRFILFAGVVAPLISSVIAAGIFVLQGEFSLLQYGKWVVGDALGMMLIAPTAMIVADALARPRRPSRREVLDWLMLSVLGTGLTVAVFAQTGFPLLFLVAPIVLAHAFRLGSLGTACSTATVAVVATAFTMAGSGPIAMIEGTMAVKLLVLQSFLVSAFIMGLPVAAVLNTRRRMTRELAERERRFALLTGSITDAVMQYDISGTCTYISPSSKSVLGVPGSEFIHKQPKDRAHPDSIDELLALQHRLLSGESDKERLIYRRFIDDEAGNPVYIEADCASTFDYETGERDGVIVSARDVTSRVELEHQLVAARKAAEAADAAKSQFLANMSHEIRTPMNGVLGFAELLMRSDLGKEQRGHAELIVESSRSMMALLNDVLDISKIEAGQIEIVEETVDLAHLLNSCVRLHQAHAKRKNIDLTLKYSDELPSHISCDPIRLRQIVNNLIGNAVKFTDDGRVTLFAERAGREQGGGLILAIEDTGIGIEKERLDQIFLPFEQADGAISRQYGGTGLGLSISRKLADLLDGKLTVESHPGAGSCFTLAMPLVEAEAPALREPAPELPKDRRIRPTPTASRVLLVEDHDVNRMLMTAMLERCGQTVIIAEDGFEAIAAVEEAVETDTLFDLVLMDIQMPRCDGYAATREIRRIGVGADQLPIVALTANAFAEDVVAAKRAGMQAHLSKPVVFDDLISALALWLPTRIIDDEAAEGRNSDGGQNTGTAEPASGADAKTIPGVGQPSDELFDRWQSRRQEAIQAVRESLERDSFSGDLAASLARTMHKLAGTAGMFGEDTLGEKARNFERALRCGVDDDVCVKLAQELLELDGGPEVSAPSNAR